MKKSAACLFVIVASLYGCTPEAPPAHSPHEESNTDLGRQQAPAPITVPTLQPSGISPLGRAVLKFADQQFGIACPTIQALRTDISGFLVAPSDARLKVARDAWVNARNAVIGIHFFRYFPLADPAFAVFFPSPNDPDETDSLNVWAFIDTFPLTGGYLDRLEEYPYSGLAYSDTPLTESFLLSEYQFSDPRYVTLGLSPMEFMLWGEKGLRSAADYLPSPQLPEEEQRAAKRRSTLLEVQTNTLARHMALLCQSWQSDEGFSRQQWKSRPVAQHAQWAVKMMKGFFLYEFSQWLSVQPSEGIIYQPRAPFSRSSPQAIGALSELIRQWRTMPEVADLIAQTNGGSEFESDALLNELETQMGAFSKEQSSAPATEEQITRSKHLLRIQQLSTQMVQRLNQWRPHL